MIKVLFVCYGNICRSPMAEFVLRSLVENRGIEQQFEIASVATSSEEIWGSEGNPIYPPAQRELKKHGIGRTEYTDFSRKRAKQITIEDYAYYDYLLCADKNNIRNAQRHLQIADNQKFQLLMDYTNRPGTSIADPWYTGNFEETYRDVLEGCEGFLDYLSR